MANTNRSDIHELFLRLVRLGIATPKDTSISKNILWVELKTLADEQGLTAVVLDGIDRLQLNSLVAYEMPLQMKLEWIVRYFRTMSRDMNSIRTQYHL